MEHKGIQGLKLPELENRVTDQEFANDTNLYLANTIENLNRAKAAQTFLQ